MKFQLEIRLGNDASKTAADVAGMLAALSTKLLGIGDMELAARHGGNLFDLNGNRVGEWKVGGR
jgi:hypothetical protein